MLMKTVLTLLIILNSISLWATPFSKEKYDRLSLSNLPVTAQRAIYKAFDSADYYDHGHFAKKRWIMVVDFSQNSRSKRGYLIDLKRKKVISYHVAHGENSGDGKGNSVAFSNIVDSHQSSLGLYVTDETYRGKHGKSLRLKGLESTNDLAFDRAIVIHSADYANENVVTKQGFLGTSWGCPAVGEKHIRKIVRKLNSKSFFYIYHERFSNL